MICVTESSTALAEAPGYLALMTIAGGAIDGYWDTGSCWMDRAPASMMTMAMTHAKMGRSMKKRAMVGYLTAPRRPERPGLHPPPRPARQRRGGPSAGPR